MITLKDRVRVFVLQVVAFVSTRFGHAQTHDTMRYLHGKNEFHVSGQITNHYINTSRFIAGVFHHFKRTEVV
jgi:hypothetical protein